jgi:hypothetical protein
VFLGTYSKDDGDDDDNGPEYYYCSTASTPGRRVTVIMDLLLSFDVVPFDCLCVYQTYHYH